MGKTTYTVNDDTLVRLMLAMTPVTGVDPTRDFLTAGTTTDALSPAPHMIAPK
jgi:hypothetical protein